MHWARLSATDAMVWREEARESESERCHISEPGTEPGLIMVGKKSKSYHLTSHADMRNYISAFDL